MTGSTSAATPDASQVHARRARILMAGRGDALTPHLTRALTDRYDMVGGVDAELSQLQRLLVAASTFRPSRTAWVERFYKSELAVWLRSRQASRAVATRGQGFDVVFQIHALFRVDDPRTVIYVDCTHQQAAEQWPGWNPLGPAALERWYERERRQYRAAAHLFAFSQETQASLVHHYGVPPERVSAVGAGANFDDLPALAGERAPNAPPTVLFVGNDFIRKGGPRLLEAFRLVRETVPEARLRIVGTPHPISPQPGVEVLGRVAGRERMSQLYVEADVFCLPSVFDPFALVMLEAMAHGVPCVATPTCGVPEIVVDGETGIMVPKEADAVQPLAAALVELLTDPQRAAEMGAAGRRRVEQQFLWTHVVERMSPVLDRMSTQTPGPHPPRTAFNPSEGKAHD